MKVNRIAVMFAILAAALYAINIPLCKIILSHIAPTMLAALVLGFVSYGLSINFYIKAQKDLGAAKTGAYYSIAPFLGVIMGIVFLGERPPSAFSSVLCLWQRQHGL